MYPENQRAAPVVVAPGCGHVRKADFESVYHGASREATECAMNLVKTSDMVVGRVAAILRAFGLSPPVDSY